MRRPPSRRESAPIQSQRAFEGVPDGGSQFLRGDHFDLRPPTENPAPDFFKAAQIEVCWEGCQRRSETIRAAHPVKRRWTRWRFPFPSGECHTPKLPPR